MAVSEKAASGVPLSEVRAMLDEGLVQVATSRGDPAARRDAALAMMEALADVDAALSDPSLFQQGTSRALSRIRAAHAEPDSGAAEVLSRCLSALADIRWEPRASAPVVPGPGAFLRASVGEPAVLDLGRGRIPARVPIFQDGDLEPLAAPEAAEIAEPPPLTLAQLEAALAAAEAEDDAPPAAEPPAEEPLPAPPASEDEAILAYYGAAVTEEKIVFERARVCLEDLALLGSLRRPLADQGWAGRAEPERRLLARVDAIAACGANVLPALVSLLEERPVPDPELTWALVFLFGSIAGADEQAMRLARVAPLEADGMIDAVADALALAPAPRITDVVAEWLGDPAAERRAAAAIALSRRGALSTAQALVAASDADVRVALAGAAALATSAGPVDPAALWRLSHHADERVVHAALESALIRRSVIAVRRVAELVEEGRPGHAEAAILLAIASGSDAFDSLRAAAASGSPAALEALGWFGHPDAVPLLLEHLQGETAGPAAKALELLTGASLLTAEPLPWREWWAEHEKTFRPGARHRSGHPWSLADDLRQIEGPEATARERRLAFLELCARSGSSLPFDADAFVARQRRQLADWSVVAQKHSQPGGWPVRLEP